MTAILVILLIVLLLFLLYALTTVGRVCHPGLTHLRGWSYAHRGLYGQGVPENSMQAFQLARDAGYGIELDVHLLKDGNLAVIHDAALKRTTGAEGKIEDLTAEQLKEYSLEGTDQTIPLFQDVLEMVGGRVPLVVELKEVGNCAALCETTCRILDQYEGVYCVESFDPRCVRWLKIHRPDIIRGQLTEDYFKSTKVVLPWYLRFLLKHQMMNFLTLPDFVAYRYRDRRTISNFVCRKFWGVQGVAWTVQNREEYNQAVAEGWLPIFEGFRP